VKLKQLLEAKQETLELLDLTGADPDLLLDILEEQDMDLTFDGHLVTDILSNEPIREAKSVVEKTQEAKKLYDEGYKLDFSKWFYDVLYYHPPKKQLIGRLRYVLYLKQLIVGGMKHNSLRAPMLGFAWSKGGRKPTQVTHVPNSDKDIDLTKIYPVLCHDPKDD
jgi:hypothetical protein